METGHIPGVLAIIFIRKMMAGRKPPMFFSLAIIYRSAGIVIILFKLVNWVLVPG